MSAHGPFSKRVCNRRPTSSSRQLAFYFLLILLLTFVIFKGGSYRLLRPLSSSVHINKSTPSKKVTITTATTTNTTEKYTIPPLKDLIGKNGKIIGDISWMLDFAIIGFPKSGTSFLKKYLNQTNEAFVYHREFCIKKPSDLKRFVETYHELHVRFQQQQQQQQQSKQNNNTIRFGLKCPGVLYRSYDMKIYKTYFPNTKLVVGIRHPVSWFESFYNYQMVRNVSMPSSTASLVGKCENHQKVCTDRARFHAALARLRKTPLVEKEEINLLFGTRYENETDESKKNYNHSSSSHSQQRRQQRFLSSNKVKQRDDEFPNKLLLYEVRQLHQNDSTRTILSEALRNYIDIQQDLPPILSYKNAKPRAINICDDAHANVRRLLVEHGRDAAVWMTQYLMKNPTVEIASPESFGRLLESWSVDPCANTAMNER